MPVRTPLPDMADRLTPARRVPPDQAHGLRQIFAGQAGPWLLPVAANPHVACSALVLDGTAAALARHGQRVLVVDAAGNAPAADERAALDLAACVEPIAPGVAYLPARGLPRAHVDTRGNAAALVDALVQAVPQATVLLLHADAGDLGRMLQRRALRPVLLAADQAESLQHAYGSAKLLARRGQFLTCDLLLCGPLAPARAGRLRETLATCLEHFLGVVLQDSAVVEPAAPQASEDLLRLLAGQQQLQQGDGRAARPSGAWEDFSAISSGVMHRVPRPDLPIPHPQARGPRQA
jgi:hypothetical protein